MTMWNELLRVLDRMFGFEDRVSSQVKKIHQTYDSNTGEHVFWFEYRLTGGDSPPPKPDLDMLEEKRAKRIAYLTELVRRANESTARRLED